MNQYNEYNKLRDIFILFLLATIYINQFSIKQERTFNSFMFNALDDRQNQNFNAITDIYEHIDVQYDVLKILTNEYPEEIEIKSVVIK